MRAVVVRELGGPEQLAADEWPAPEAGPGLLVVDVAAGGVNFMDVYARQGRPPYGGEVPFVPGAEGAGTVTAVGPDVTGFAVGDRVAWTAAPGSYAEQVAVPAVGAVPVPDGPLDLLLTQWRHTAEIHADPELAAALAGPFDGPDGGLVPRPEGGE
jgi:NADPH2:quinone reductase